MEKHNPHIHRIMISTTSRFTGEYESPHITIAHAWPDSFAPKPQPQLGMQANPYSRNYFVVSLEIADPPKEEGRLSPIPNYRSFGDQVCAALSILFGKRFDNHGFIITHGFFSVPDFGHVRPSTYFTAGPNNHSPRPDLEVELKLDQFGRVAALFTDNTLDSRFRHILFAAARFYLGSLQMFDVEPESAYLDLVTCGEILANYYKFPDEELYDEDTRKTFTRIESEMTKGDKVVRKFKGSMCQIKRAYALTITRLTTDYFFGQTESKGHGQLKKEDFEKRIKAAYDLRSQYVHTGIDFGSWMAPNPVMMNEVQLGWPNVEDENFKKALTLAPLYYGLERVMRFCLLRFIHLHGVRIDDRLDGPSPSATTAHQSDESEIQPHSHTFADSVIAPIAYAIWESEERQHGHHERHWMMAIQQLLEQAAQNP